MKIINSFDECINLFKNNALIAYPTETFYALGTVLYKDADMHKAMANTNIEKIFVSKQRDLKNPLPLIVKDYEQVLEITDISTEIENYLEEICNTFWPDSLSICLQASSIVPAVVVAETNKIVVRQSPFKLVQNIVDTLNCPIISTSANISGQAPVIFSHEITKDLHIDAVVDIQINNEMPKGGQASSIIELLPNKGIKILRKGAFNIEKIVQLGYAIVD